MGVLERTRTLAKLTAQAKQTYDSTQSEANLVELRRINAAYAAMWNGLDAKQAQQVADLTPPSLGI